MIRDPRGTAWLQAETVPQLLARRAAGTPEAEAFRVESAGGHWSTISWRSFADEVARLSGALANCGLRRGDRLALIAPVSLKWELLHHAGLRLGAVIIGMDTHDLPARLADMAKQAAVNAFVVSVPQALSACGTEQLANTRFVLRLDGIPSLDIPCRQLDWDELLACGQGPDAVQHGSLPVADDDATIIFTSGTTGRPKGIPYTHRQLLLAIHAICDAFSFVGRDGRLLCWLPLSNLFQRMVNLGGLRQGLVTCLLDDPRRVMEVVARVSPDVFIGVPRFYEKLYDGIRERVAAMPALPRRAVTVAWRLGARVSRCRREGRPVPPMLRLMHFAADRLVLRRVRDIMGKRLRCMVTGSAPMPVHLLTEFHALGWVILEAYGLSENVMPMAMNRLEAFRFGTVGRPMPGNDIAIDSADGSVRVRGPGVFRGYLGDPRSPLDSDGYYVTGDLGSLDDDGYLRLVGRSSEMIKTSTGRRVAPAPVETALTGIARIDQAILIGNGRKCLMALCTLASRPSSEGDRAALVRDLHDQIESLDVHQRPQIVGLLNAPFTIEAGLLTPNLKLRRRAIEEACAAEIAQLIEALDTAQAAGKHELLVVWLNG